MTFKILPTTVSAPKSRGELQAAIRACLILSPKDCSIGPHGPIGSWDVSEVTDMSQLFNKHFAPGADMFTGEISGWDVSKVTHMYGMFHSASSFNGDISEWDVSRVSSMIYMFHRAASFNVDISAWDVSRVISMLGMFNEASSFTQTLCGAWSTSKADKTHMFDGSPGRVCTTTTSSSK